MQWLIIQVLQTTRLATSTGSDCDSWGADFGFIRLPAVSASGTVTFSRFTPTQSSFVGVGSSVLTGDMTQSFFVIADPSNPSYSTSLNGFTVGPGVASIDVAVSAATPGTGGNVLADAISLLGSPLPGIDNVTNAAGFTGGLNAESDADFRLRFGNYLASLARATQEAISAAILNIQLGLSTLISENIDQSGNIQMGHFVVTVDDGTGHPPVSLLSQVQAAVEIVRPIGTSFAVQGPIVVLANVAMTLTVTSPLAMNSAIAAVQNSITSYIAGLGIGITLNYSKLMQLAYEASTSVINVTDVTLNGGTVDLTPPLFGVVHPGTISVN
ncbi:MAG TPA: baseplate J/gp47 family protein [Acetobacteraceae bacterium]|nr:baseplate J/gp47 family protein [Acetobacteraceae bacterium]HQU01374.1 baseplate J/gp47 family protein [Acetobacteraceae bacterium]